MEDKSWIAQAKRSTQGLHLDLSHHQINVPIWNSLTALLAASPFEELRQGMFSGDRINLTENRAVGHTRIRTPEHLMSDPTLASIRQFSDGVRSGQLQGATGKPFETIINIGIGGSDLGPKMVCEALSNFQTDSPTVHFVANVDGAEIQRVIAHCDPETTLIVIASKTFTTQETMLNAQTAKDWLIEHLGRGEKIAPHLVALTTCNRTGDRIRR
jgi:glucose-6-phosphate isomerase